MLQVHRLTPVIALISACFLPCFRSRMTWYRSCCRASTLSFRGSVFSMHMLYLRCGIHACFSALLYACFSARLPQCVRACVGSTAIALIGISSVIGLCVCACICACVCACTHAARVCAFVRMVHTHATRPSACLHLCSLKSLQNTSVM